MNFLKLIKKFIKTFFYSVLNREGKKIKLYSNLLLTNKFHLLGLGPIEVSRAGPCWGSRFAEELFFLFFHSTDTFHS